MRLRLTIRVAVPVALMLFTLVLAWWSLRVNSLSAMVAIEQRALQDLRVEMTRFQAQIEHALRVSDIEWIQEGIAQFGADPQVIEAALLNQKDIIIASSHRSHIGQAAQSMAEHMGPDANALRVQLKAEVRERHLGDLRLTPDGNALIGVYPILLATVANGLRPKTQGLLCIHRDLTALRLEAAASVGQQTLSFVVGLGAFALVLGIFFHLRITRRIGALVDATRRISEGDLETRTPTAGNDELAGLASELNDMMKQRRVAEETLKESEERYREIVEETDDLITRVDSEGRFSYTNHMAGRIFGIDPEECIGMSAFDFIHPEDRQSTEAAFAGWIQDGRSSVTFENRLVNQVTGDIREMLWAIHLHYDEKRNLTGISNIARDLTDRRKLEGILLKTKELESLGALSGGIAHDFNNLLSIILGNLSLVKEGTGCGSQNAEFLQEAENAAVRGKELTSRLITFSKGGDPVKKVMHIGVFIEKAVESALAESGMDCKMVVPDDLFPVEIDAAQMEQVIRNIVTNAHEAMNGKGVVRVHCENVTTADEDPLHLEEGKYVKISIADQGGGISEDDLGKIFDPYFSTKERGTEKGMGLGLSVCHSVAKKHNGLITVESERGAGATFSLYLPASEKVITEPEPEESDLLREPIRGSGKLLVMDDEKMMRKLAINRLRPLGYHVQVARDGAESIELYRTAKDSGKPFDLVILDLTVEMGMGGRETIQKLRDIDNEVRGIVASGYSDDPVITNFREYGFKGALIKPYTTYELSQVLHEIISDRQRYSSTEQMRSDNH